MTPKQLWGSKGNLGGFFKKANDFSLGQESCHLDYNLVTNFFGILILILNNFKSLKGKIEICNYKKIYQIPQ